MWYLSLSVPPEVVVEDIDWTDCPDVEQVPGKVSGQPVVVGTRILAQRVIDNADDGYTAEQIAAARGSGRGCGRGDSFRR